VKKLHLHIGSPKTGTTSIQKTFFDNREALNRQGYTYSSNKFNDHLLYFATKSPRRNWPRQFKGVKKQALQNSLNEYFQHIEREFKSSDYEQHILSTEYLFLSNPEYIGNVIDYLEQFFSEIKVLVFIRSPEEYYRSMQQQTVKARSYITSPLSFRYDFKKVIEAWKKLCDIEVIEYRRGKDSCIELCNRIGIKFNKLSKTERKSNASLSIEQMVLLEKIQRNIYPKHEDHFKNHLGVLHRINAPFTSKARLKPEIKKLIYYNHRQDLEWLKKEYSIDFLNEELQTGSHSFQDVFNNGKATVRDVYRVENEQEVDRYESLVIDALLKKLVQSG
jgi:hypothetical protein